MASRSAIFLDCCFPGSDMSDEGTKSLHPLSEWFLSLIVLSVSSSDEQAGSIQQAVITVNSANRFFFMIIFSTSVKVGDLLI